jgi:tRNA (guanine37-N1)-methyltransferase
MHFSILTILPNVFEPYLKASIIGSALRKELFSYNIINIRDFAKNKHKKVDDTPFGGGAGMVIKPDVIASAIDSIPKPDLIVYLSPKGKVLDQQIAIDYSSLKHIALICGRYEGIDQRVIDYYNIAELSIGDYILSGGELAAMVVIDSVVRNKENVLGNANSLSEESFACVEKIDIDEILKQEKFLSNKSTCKLLEYPIYTKPRIWRGRAVPSELISGNHSLIKNWRLKMSVLETIKKRPDLL